MPTVEAVAFAVFAFVALFAQASAKLLDDRERRLAAASGRQSVKGARAGTSSDRPRESAATVHERVSSPSHPPVQ